MQATDAGGGRSRPPRRRPRFRVSRSWLGPVLGGSVVLLVAGGGAAASLETGTVGSFWEGLWWALSLMTTVGFIGEQPETVGGALVSVALMLSGFVLLALVSASLASLFVREDNETFEVEERTAENDILRLLRELDARMAALESRLDDRLPAGPPGADDQPPPGADEQP